MANHLMTREINKFLASPLGGESHQHNAQNLKEFAGKLDSVLVGIRTIDSVNLAGGASFTGQFIAPYDLEITEIRAVFQALTGTDLTATLTTRQVTAAGSTNVSPLAAAIDFDNDLTVANESVAMTLHATEANRYMRAGDVCKCVFASAGVGTLTGGGVSIKYKPIAPF